MDTGTAWPIACKNITFRPLGYPMIKAVIAKFLELGHICQIFEGAWLSKNVLAPKPHQEKITDIADFVRSVCVNYITLDSVSKVTAMPIPRCDKAVGNSF